MPAPDARAYVFGPFRLDLTQRVLLRDGALVPLTPKAFDTLAALVERAGRVVSKQELMEAVWPESFVEETNLTQNVFTLRRALGDGEEGRRFVETVPKRGYRFVAPVRAAPREPASIDQLTFRRGVVHAARFAPDGRAVLYGAAWEGGPHESYLAVPGRAEEERVGPHGAALLAVSPGGEVAAALDPQSLRGYVHAGTLVRAPLSGGDARVVAERVQAADFSPDGEHLAVVREVDGRSRLELPVGNVLVETGGWISHPRVSPSGRLVAYLRHPVLGDDSGSVEVVDQALNASVLSEEWVSLQGLAWSPDGDEVWFSASRSGNARAIHAVTLGGDERSLLAMAGCLTLHDVSRDGRVLFSRDDERIGINARRPGAGAECDLSWHDWSLARDLSDDGELLLFTEAGASGGSTYTVYLRRTDGSSAVRLGEGSALALSPDGEWALAKSRGAGSRLLLLPTRSGAPVALEGGGVTHHPWAGFFPDGERVLFAANPPGRGTRLYVQEARGGPPRALPVGEGVSLTSPRAVSPDGRRIAFVGADSLVYTCSADGGERRRVEGLEPGDAPVRWTADGRALFVRRGGHVPARILRHDLDGGGTQEWLSLVPPDPSGVYEILRVLMTPDGASYAYTYTRALSTLFVMTGI